MLEEDIEALIAEYPDLLLGENLRLLDRQRTISGKRIDLLFLDEEQNQIIVEVKRGTLKREAIGQGIEYFGIFKKNWPQINCKIYFVANKIPEEMTLYFLHSTNNVKFIEISIERLQQILEKEGATLQKRKGVLKNQRDKHRVRGAAMDRKIDNGIFPLLCTSSTSEILAKLNELKEIKDRFGTNKPITKYYYFIELLATDARFGIQQDWYTIERGNPDSIFSAILDTEEHPLFVKSGRETRVYRWWAQPIVSRTTDVGDTPIFDTLLKTTKENPRPIAYKLSRNAIEALQIHFGKRIIFRK